MDSSKASFVGSFNVIMSLSTSSVLFSSLSSSSLPSSSMFAVFLLSTTALIGHVTGSPKGYDYYDDPFNSPNIVTVDKVVDYYSKPQYAFGYEVDDYYNQLSHGRWEIRDGDVVKGQYRVLLPDGRIQIVSYIADKFGYRPTVEYIGKGVHPPPPPVYANIKPVALASASVPVVPAPPLPVIAASPAPLFVSTAAPPLFHPTALPAVLASASPIHIFPKVKAPLGTPFTATPAPIAIPYEDYHPVKIKLNSLPVNGPLPVVDPYAVGYGVHLDPAFAASSHNVNKISRKRALLYDRTLFRKDVEKRAAIIKKNARVKARILNRTSAPITSLSS